MHVRSYVMCTFTMKSKSFKNSTEPEPEKHTYHNYTHYKLTSCFCPLDRKTKWCKSRVTEASRNISLSSFKWKKNSLLCLLVVGSLCCHLGSEAISRGAPFHLWPTRRSGSSYILSHPHSS